MRVLLFLLLAFLFSSCVGPNEAERATYQVIGPAHAAYVQADQNLTPAQKQARLDLIESWRLRVGGAK